jgi:hypothetical protein
MRLLILLCWSLAVGATKPCQESPCASRGSFDAKKCEGAAAWVVTARLESVVHHPADPPVSKDFAEFVVRVEKWEKGKSSSERLHLRVGWCNNPVGPPEKVGARVRIYGTGDPNAADPQYLWLEQIG